MKNKVVNVLCTAVPAYLLSTHKLFVICIQNNVIICVRNCLRSFLGHSNRWLVPGIRQSTQHGALRYGVGPLASILFINCNSFQFTLVNLCSEVDCSTYCPANRSTRWNRPSLAIYTCALCSEQA